MTFAKECTLRFKAEDKFERPVNSEISNSDESFHCVLLTGREIHGKIGDVAGFNDRSFASIRHPQDLTMNVPSAPMDSRQPLCVNSLS